MGKMLVLHASTHMNRAWKGPKRYIRIFVYPTHEALRSALRRNVDSNIEEDCLGLFRPSYFREHYDSSKGWVDTSDKHWVGSMYLSEENLTYNIVVHECVHAASQIYRLDVKPIVNLGRGCKVAEENFSYILGDLSDSVIAVLRDKVND